MKRKRERMADKWVGHTSSLTIQLNVSRPVSVKMLLTQKWLHLTSWSSTAQRPSYFLTIWLIERRCRDSAAQLHDHWSSSSSCCCWRKTDFSGVRQFSVFTFTFHCLLLFSIAFSPFLPSDTRHTWTFRAIAVQVLVVSVSLSSTAVKAAG